MNDTNPGIEDLAAIDEACDRFERALRAGRPLEMEQFLGEYATRLQAHLRAAIEDIRNSDIGQSADSAQLLSTTRIAHDNGLQGGNPDGSAQGSSADAQPGALGDCFGRYEIRRLLGEGGFGRVWLAFDRELHREVAIKVPKLRRPDDARHLDEFLREARRAAGLDHPHIVPVYDAGRTDQGVLFVVSKFIDGCTLRQQIADQQCPPGDAISMVCRIADALHHAHTKGIVHRDVKPGNVLIDRQGTPFLSDFGLAISDIDQMKSRGEVSGSPAYMSPEQVRGLSHHLDGRSDIWSLSVILYELLTGHRPFRATAIEELFEEILKREPRPPRQFSSVVPPDIEAICLKGLSKRVIDRPLTALDFQRDLAAAWKAHANAAASITSSVPADLPSRIVFNVPRLPACYVERNEHLERIRDLILMRNARPVGVTGVPMLGIQGRGGLGKTVIAAAIARDKSLQDHFCDGVIWLTFGQQPGLATLQRQLLKCLGTESPAFEGAAEFRAQLEQLLEQRCLLIVLDDVWSMSHVEDFVVPVASVCFLVTTRDGSILTRLNATEYGLDVLTKDLALAFLSDWAAEPPEVLLNNADVDAVLRETGRLPLALSVCGAMRRDGHAWKDIAEALAGNMLDFLDEDAHYNHRSVLNCLTVGIEFLSQESPEGALRCQELAVFPGDTLIPESAVIRYWQQTAGLSGLRTRRLLTTLHRRNLLSYRDTGHGRFAEFHDLQHEYLRSVAEHAGALTRYHRALIEGYRACSVEDWTRTGDDGYFHRHILRHLAAVDDTALAAELILSFDWLTSKLIHCGLQELLDDLSLFPHLREARLVASALRLSSHVIQHDASQLPGQLMARLARQFSGLLAPVALLQSLNQCLIPVTCSLTAPGALMQTLCGSSAEVTAIASLGRRRQLVSGHRDGTLTVWNPGAVGQPEKLNLRGRQVEFLCVAPDDDTLLVLYAGGIMQAISCGELRELWSVETHQVHLCGLNVSPDGTRVFTITPSGEVTVWHITDGLCQERMAAPEWSPSVALDESDSAGEDPRHREFRSTVSSVHPRQRSSEFDLICAGTGPENSLCQTPQGISARFFNHGRRCRTIARDAVRRRFYTGGTDGLVRVWHYESLQLMATLEGHQEGISCLAVDEDSGRIISGSYDATMILWDVDTCSMLARFDCPGGPIRCVSLLPGTGVAAAASADGSLRVWDLNVADTKARENSGAHTSEVTRVQILPGGQFAVSAGADGQVLLHDLSTGAFESVCGSTSGTPIRDLAVIEDGRRLVIICETGECSCWRVARNQAQPVWSVRLTARYPDKLVVTESGHLLAISDRQKDIYVLGAHDGKQIAQHYAPTHLRPRIVSGSDTLVVARYDGSLMLRPLAQGASGTFGRHADNVTDLQVSRDGRLLVSVGRDLLLKVWDPATQTQRGKSLHGHDRIVTSCALDAYGRVAVTGGNDGRVILWDLEKEQEFARLPQGVSPIAHLSVTEDNRRIVSAARDGSVCVWDLWSQRRLGAFTADAEITTIATSQTHIVAGDKTGQVHILQMAPERWQKCQPVKVRSNGVCDG